MLDLHPAARSMAQLVDGVTDDQLTVPTPCTQSTLGDLLDHVDGLSLAFTWAAAKENLDAAAPPGVPDASRLGPDWRNRIPERLAALADAWLKPDAWEGMTKAGGIEMPGDVAASVALDELVIHGWDIARASAQPYAADDADIAACVGLVSAIARDEQRAANPGLFGPVIAVPETASAFDRLLGLTGRDPNWMPPR